MAPSIRAGDDDWRDVVFWVLQSLILAEELGLSSQSVTNMEQSPNVRVRQFLGIDGPFFAEPLGLNRNWAMHAIEAAGNYGQIYDRHFGAQSALNLRRGQNGLSTSGGLLIAKPIN